MAGYPPRLLGFPSCAWWDSRALVGISRVRAVISRMVLVMMPPALLGFPPGISHVRAAIFLVRAAVSRMVLVVISPVLVGVCGVVRVKSVRCLRYLALF